ncbi:hypothetical protein CLV63_105110 [Murinocardiopsis flavida]|uniref:Uncharacterized protein n=1 Tax=Murinocardiopsis flavida TaxID=645275 RepID=A0A2P8DMJ0_9ACTN|nr:hypothetical protein [Murinocardiopsis flavida]PSK98436.1 hypothetical protein CLV63_105110 [Murinocardiopsis flavida]
MSLTVGVYTPAEVTEDELLRLLAGIGAELHPDQWTSAVLSRGAQHVWITIGPADTEELLEPDDAARITHLLGGPAGLETELRVSTVDGRRPPGPAVEIVTAIAARHQVAVFGEQTVFGPAELRSRSAAGGSAADVFR